MLSVSLENVTSSLIGLAPHKTRVRQSKVKTPQIEKKGAELKCSAPLGALPALAAARSSSAII